MVWLSRAERRKAERERKKREKKEAIREKQKARRSGRPVVPRKKDPDGPDPKLVPWDESNPKCPNCGADWEDQEEMYSCQQCGRIALKSDTHAEDCDRCGRPFLLELLNTWTGTDYEDHHLCSECFNQVWVHGDMEWLEKSK